MRYTPAADEIMEGKVIYSEETRFGVIQVLDTVWEGKAVRYLLVDGWQESAMYRDPAYSNRLIFPYMQCLSWPLSLRPDTTDIFLIGGGGFAWPRAVLAGNSRIRITVAERYEEIVRVSEEFFGLKDLYLEYPGRLRTETGDGFELLRQGLHHFDLIVNDAFVGRKPAGGTLDETILMHDHLSSDGIYAINVTSAVKGPGALHLHHLLKVLEKVFIHTDVMICEPDRSPYESQNILVAASDGPLDGE